MLVVPPELSVVRIERHRGAGVKALLRVYAAAHSHPWFGLRHSPVGQIEIRVIAAGDPCFTTGTQPVWKFAPAISSGFAIARHCIELPELFAGVRVICTDEAAVIVRVTATSSE